MSSDNVSHEPHKSVCGARGTGWALPTRRVREMGTRREQKQTLETVALGCGLVGERGRKRKVVKKGDNFGEGRLLAGERRE